MDVFHTAPRPVLTPQPNKQAFLRSASGLILAQEISASTVYSANVLQPIKWKMVLPSDFRVKREVLSGMRPLPCVERIFGHMLVFGDAQKMQLASLHCGV